MPGGEGRVEEVSQNLNSTQQGEVERHLADEALKEQRVINSYQRFKAASIVITTVLLLEYLATKNPNIANLSILTCSFTLMSTYLQAEAKKRFDRLLNH